MGKGSVQYLTKRVNKFTKKICIGMGPGFYPKGQHLRCFTEVCSGLHHK